MRTVCSVMCRRAKSTGVRCLCFVPRAVRDPGYIGMQAHGEQAPAQEGTISNGGPAGDLSLWKGAKGLSQSSVFDGLGAICYSSVTNGIVAGFCRLQVPDIASQDAVQSWHSGRPSR